MSGRRFAVEHADAPRAFGLLARRGERPCCAVETRDELPPSHFRPPRNSAEPIALGAAWEPDRRVCGCAVWSVPGPDPAWAGNARPLPQLGALRTCRRAS